MQAGPRARAAFRERAVFREQGQQPVQQPARIRRQVRADRRRQVQPPRSAPQLRQTRIQIQIQLQHRLRNSGHLGTRGRRKSSYRLFGNGFNSLLNGQFSLCSGLHLSSCSSERRFLGDLVQRHGLRRFGFRRGERIKRQHLAQIQRLGHLERLGNGFRPDIFHWFRSCRDLRQRVSRRHEPECVVHPAQFFERQVAFQSIASAGYTPAINQLRQFPQSLLHTCQIHSRIHFAFKDRKNSGTHGLPPRRFFENVRFSARKTPPQRRARLRLSV